MGARIDSGWWRGAAVCLGVLGAIAGCSGPSGEVEVRDDVDPSVQMLSIDFDQTLAVSSSVFALHLPGTERLVANSVSVRFEGEVGGAPVSWDYSAKAAPPSPAGPAPTDAIGEVKKGLVRAQSDTAI